MMTCASASPSISQSPKNPSSAHVLQLHHKDVTERKEFCCFICHKVMTLPLTTPCAHNFCKSCLQDTFDRQTFMKGRTCEGRRALRAKKNIMKCPSCSNDISEYLQNPQVSRELMSVIESLQRQTKEMEESAVLGDEILNTDEKTDDVKDKDEEPEADDKVETYEAAFQDEMEVVCESSNDDETEKTSPKGKILKE